ncbi:MAG TPA: energy transducer TonB [Chitinophagaceae bacterium]|nr:energy transducer TonB [Chitinophagaceae bacterium]
MEPNKILQADILDIIFDGKNKAYGAYDLRKTYNKTLVKALLFTSAILLLAFLGSVMANMLNKGKKTDQIEVLETQMAEIKKDEPPPPPPPPPPPTPPPPPEVNQVKFTPPKIVKDEEVKPDEKIEEIKEDQVISTKTVESENKEQIVQAPVEDKGTQVVEVPKVSDDENKIFTKVEVEASFPGGESAWRRYLQNNLNPNTPVDNGAPEGTYQVVVRFIVGRDGSISDVQAETSHGYGMEQQAMKIIKTGPKWTPAIQKGRNVNASRRQPITFVVQEQ